MSVDVELAWPPLRLLAEEGDVAELISAIRREEDDGTRIALYRSAIRHLAFDDWRNKNLDVMIALADAAIKDCELLGGDYLQQANVICYNTSANLCDCWGDSFERESRHFEKGIEYAKKALWYREHLGKGPGAMAMAIWALGKHQQSLGRFEDATASFKRCLELETEFARELGMPAAISSKAPPTYLIAGGYLALMERDNQTLDRLKAALAEMATAGGEQRDDAELISGQLSETANKMGLPW